MKLMIAVMAALLACTGVAQVQGAIFYSNGFEVDATGWSSTSRVPSGTSGVPSAGGAYHGVASSGAFTQWGGYNFGAGNVPTAFQEYSTFLDIYLDIDGAPGNDFRFDYTSAINNASGTHLRDFAFNVGFYDDLTGPGGNTDRFVISASNNTGRANSNPKNVARDPIAISTTGWYTFEHHFYNDGGTLAADLSIYDAANTLLNTWTLSNPADLIAGVGGNRYGWLPGNEFGSARIDNALMQTPAAVPEPSAIAIWSVLGLWGSVATWRSRRSRRRAEG